MYFYSIKVMMILVVFYDCYETVSCYPATYNLEPGNFFGLFQPIFTSENENYETPDMSTTYNKPVNRYRNDDFLGFLSKPIQEVLSIEKQLIGKTASEHDNHSYKNNEKSFTENFIPEKNSYNTNIRPNYNQEAYSIENDTQIQNGDKANVEANTESNSIKNNINDTIGDNIKTLNEDKDATGKAEYNDAETNCTLVIESSCEEQRKLFDDIFKYSDLDNNIETTTDYESTTFDDSDISIRIPPAVVASLLG